MHVPRARMLGFTPGTSAETDRREGGLERIKLQIESSVGGSEGKKQSHFLGGCRCGVAILGVCCRYLLENNSNKPNPG